MILPILCILMKLPDGYRQSMLSPLLFLIYVNDLPTLHHKQNSLTQFADDTAQWVFSLNIHIAAKFIQQDDSTIQFLLQPNQPQSRGATVTICNINSSIPALQLKQTCCCSMLRSRTITIIISRYRMDSLKKECLWIPEM